MDFDMFQHVMKTGVIYATSRARVWGFDPEDGEWVRVDANIIVVVFVTSEKSR